ncbi:hypothetical protein B484DRAFT_393444 [Ochromonadaceae sp. CCMP2298]|nr:hypothetical protein B484DRAFT_393444 [Ochromonadaceae sp. CCMP2298]
MKLSQLSSDAPADAFYNRFEQTIVEARQERHQSHPGRSIPSIRKNPRHRSLGLSLVSLGSSDRDMSLVTDHVLIGGKSDAEDLARLMDFGVTHVLNTAQQVPNYYQQQFVYLKVAILVLNVFSWTLSF